MKAAIVNSHLLEDIFGYFPSFHDAEVLRVTLYRESAVRKLPTLEAQIHVFEITPEIENEHYVLKNHTLVTFRFSEIDELSWNGFNHQNVLSDLIIKDISDHQLERLKFEVQFDGIDDIDLHFRCRSIEITKVEPFIVKGPS